MTRLDPVGAKLRWRGFSREITPDGREPFGYNYEEVSFSSPGKLCRTIHPRGRRSRSLLLNSDDMFVILQAGDEIQACRLTRVGCRRFGPAGLAALPALC